MPIICVICLWQKIQVESTPNKTPFYISKEHSSLPLRPLFVSFGFPARSDELGEKTNTSAPATAQVGTVRCFRCAKVAFLGVAKGSASSSLLGPRFKSYQLEEFSIIVFFLYLLRRRCATGVYMF